MCEHVLPFLRRRKSKFAKSEGIVLAVPLTIGILTPRGKLTHLCSLAFLIVGNIPKSSSRKIEVQETRWKTHQNRTSFANDQLFVQSFHSANEQS